MKRLRCHLCVRAEREAGGKMNVASATGTCDEHRAVLATLPCRSGEDCDNLAGHGLWGGLCADCAARIAAIGGAAKPAKWNGRQAPKRVPKEQTAAKIAAVVREAKE